MGAGLKNERNDKCDEFYCTRGLENHIAVEATMLRMDYNDDANHVLSQKEKSQRLVKALKKQQKQQYRKKSFDMEELSKICAESTKRDQEEALRLGLEDE